MTSVQDRYARSITSSHLEVTEYTGDIDALISAGWIKESLSTLLWRVRVEFDAVDARDVVALPEMPPPDRLTGEGEEKALAEWKKGEKARIAADLKGRRLTARALAMVHLTSLREAKEALGRFTMAQATRMGLPLTPEQELAVSGRAMQAFLDPLCGVCHGIKFKTAPGTGRLSSTPCSTCFGSGRAQGAGDMTAAEFALQQSVLAELDRKMDRVARLMKRFLREQASTAA
jgi:hypothetical protein